MTYRVEFTEIDALSTEIETRCDDMLERLEDIKTAVSGISRLEIYAVRSENSCCSLRNGHAAVSGNSIPSERNLQVSMVKKASGEGDSMF